MPTSRTPLHTYVEDENVGQAWMKLVDVLMQRGRNVNPRGEPVRELLNVTWVVRDAYQNLFEHPVRKVSYRFSIAEWLHIWFGRDDVASIVQYNPQIARFSDNSKTFEGAYGPMFRKQWGYAINRLQMDLDTRQAVIQVYRRPLVLNTKDVPCTLTWQLLYRDGQLHTIVNMRSSDVWLGVVYDVVNMSMLSNIAAAELGLELGGIAFNFGSSHLYERDVAKASEVLQNDDALVVHRSPQLAGHPPLWLEDVLVNKVIPNGALHPLWLTYAHVLTAESNAAALNILCGLYKAEIRT